MYHIKANCKDISYKHVLSCLYNSIYLVRSNTPVKGEETVIDTISWKSQKNSLSKYNDANIKQNK